MIVECKNCNAFVETDEIGHFDYDIKWGKPSGRFSLVRCKMCESPILIEQDNIGNLAVGSVYDKPKVIFPIEEYKESTGVPKQLERALYESKTCYKTNAFTAASIMCRRILEGICSIKGIKERTLINSVKKMKDDGIIDAQLFEWADFLRVSGNEAAHDIEIEVTKEDARDMLDFTEAMVEYIFVFKEKLENYKKRRKVPSA